MKWNEFTGGGIPIQGGESYGVETSVSVYELSKVAGPKGRGGGSSA